MSHSGPTDSQQQPPPAATLTLSDVAGCPLLDGAGAKLGRMEDLICRLGDQGYPLITGLKARVGGRETFVPAEQVTSMRPGATQLRTAKLNLQAFERRHGEVLLGEDLQGRSVINVETAHLIKAREVQLAEVDGAWRVVGIVAGGPTWLRRLQFKRREESDGEFVDWRLLEPFVGHVPSARLRLAPRIGRLHPAQIADLVEAASHEEGEEILQAVGVDRELEADVFEELDEEHQVEFLRERSDGDVAAVLGNMASDDAADLLLEFEQDRRQPVLALMPPERQRKLRKLLGYNPSTAGGLMSDEYISLPQGATVAQAIARVRESECESEAIRVLFMHDPDGALCGELGLAELIRAESAQTLASLVEHPPVAAVSPDADIPEIARLMTDYNLVTMPVVDAARKLVGVLAVDDVLELMLPSDWRRRYGLARG
ncbi:MAG: magnesium transporter MgtE N-terminal domain-containing protein [Solirubrobacteraceae bacterium]